MTSGDRMICMTGSCYARPSLGDRLKASGANEDEAAYAPIEEGSHNVCTCSRCQGRYPMCVLCKMPEDTSLIATKARV